MKLEELEYRQGSFAILGDLQRTTLLEQVLLGRERNDEVPARLLDAISREPVDFLALLGDMVFNGCSAREWREFDALIAPIASRSLPVLPCLGNHDYSFSRALSEPRIHARFPFFRQKHYYSRKYGETLLIWLDSTPRFLGSDLWRSQATWFEEALMGAESDPNIKCVLVFSHHPPFTNSEVSDESIPIQRGLLPAFFRSSKGKGWFSGHVHSYERFEIQGKTFVVAGGGGGPRVKLYTGKNQKHVDLIKLPAPRPFHYLIAIPKHGLIELEVKGFEKGSLDLQRIDSFAIDAS